MKRRTFLKGTVASGVIVAAAGAGLLRPTEVLASAYPKSAFGVKGVDGTLKKLFGTSSVTKSSKIKFINPTIQAENSQVVPITINTSLKADSIAILVAKNPSAMAASVDLSGAAKGYFRTKIKMGKTSDVFAVVKSGGKLYSNKIKIKVTVGGCGG
ncbi:MAG: thiosulfate oxidation carrier protein SoxY [Acidiferrobacterales bacterium]